jgi:radical SAM superfamily enzyme YgiQ (UPF0313 family)
MKVLFVSTNRCRMIMPPMPLGIACLIPYLNPDRHPFRILDLLFEENPLDALQSALHGFTPDVVAFSIRNIENQVMVRSEYSLPEVKLLIDLVRRESVSRVIIGGSALGVLSNAIFQYLQPDAALAGEAEDLINPLLNALEEGSLPEDMPGLIFSGHPAIDIALVKDLNRLILPDRKCLQLEAYSRNGSVPNLVTKRGCAFRCSFCETPVAEGGQIRIKAPEKVVDEMESLLHLGLRTFFFTDPIFNYPAGYAESVAREIISRGIAMHWNAMLHPRYVSRDQIALLKKAGLSMIFLGSDHAASSMLASYAKQISCGELVAADRLLGYFELPYTISLLLGGPGETQTSVCQALDLVAGLHPAMVGIRMGIRIYPGTSLHATAIREGRIDALDDLLEPVYYLAAGAEDWIVPIVCRRVAEHSGWTIPGLSSDI